MYKSGRREFILTDREKDGCSVVSSDSLLVSPETLQGELADAPEVWSKKGLNWDKGRKDKGETWWGYFIAAS